MANRFLITGIQIGIIKACTEQFNHDPENCKNILIETMQEILDKQYVGYTQNIIDDDVEDITSYFIQNLNISEKIGVPDNISPINNKDFHSQEKIVEQTEGNDNDN